ncbi:hypothetical protein GCM10009593_05590 [Microlunatus antarcticus]
MILPTAARDVRVSRTTAGGNPTDRIDSGWDASEAGRAARSRDVPDRAPGGTSSGLGAVPDERTCHRSKA